MYPIAEMYFTTISHVKQVDHVYKFGRKACHCGAYLLVRVIQYADS